MENDETQQTKLNSFPVKKMKKVLNKAISKALSKSSTNAPSNSESTTNNNNDDTNVDNIKSHKPEGNVPVSKQKTSAGTSDLPKRQRKLSYEDVPVPLKQQLLSDTKKKSAATNKNMDASLKCLKCNLFMESPVQLTSHQCFPHQCPMCPNNINFKNSFLLNRHLSKMHSESIVSQQDENPADSEEKTHICSLCHSKFQNDIDLNKHKSCCRGNEKCEGCSSSIISKRGNRFCRKCSYEMRKRGVSESTKSVPEKNLDNSSSKKNVPTTARKSSIENEGKSKKRRKVSSKSSVGLVKKVHKNKDIDQEKRPLSSIEPTKKSTSVSNTTENESSLLEENISYETRKKYWCKKCGYGCISRYTFQLHSEQNCKTNLQHLMSCEVRIKCSPSLPLLSSPAVHVKQETEDSYPTSSSIFSNASSTDSTPQHTYSCRTCGELFTDLCSYEFHVERKHQCLKEKEPSYCRVCDTTFSTMFFFNMHACSGNKQPEESSDSLTAKPVAPSPASSLLPQHCTNQLLFNDQHRSDKCLSHSSSSSVFSSQESALPKDMIANPSTLPHVLPHAPPYYNLPSHNLYPMCENSECPDCMKFLHALPQNCLWCNSCSKPHLGYHNQPCPLQSGTTYPYFSNIVTSALGKVRENFIPNFDYNKDSSAINQQYFTSTAKDINFPVDVPMHTDVAKVSDTVNEASNNSFHETTEQTSDKECPPDSGTLPVISHVESVAAPESVLVSSSEDSKSDSPSPPYVEAHGYSIEIAKNGSTKSRYICSRCFLTIRDSSEFPKHYSEVHGLKIENVIIS